ncbi:MAG TPA: hypothetical protein VMV29_12260 [Ktedonobacterales bacterium]|nr:hypothetical protein [Ktedonobacterales bacterium]
MASDPAAVTKLYEQIPLEAMQRVSESYMAWYVNRVTQQLDETMAGLRSELRENDAKEASYRPSPNELGAIERMQRSGVTGVDLLDRMVEQGEDWLTLTMRRLDHFERTGLAPKDYSTWCEHALSGAYDWIDHERLGSSNTPAGGPGASRPAAPAASPASSPAAGVPDWLSSRGAPAPRNAGAPEEGPTAPVPSVAPRWNDNGYYGPGQQGGAQPAGAGAGQSNGNGAQGADDDGKGRNIFRIFSN